MSNNKVIAIESMKDGKLRTFGTGEYLGDLVPDFEPFRSAGLRNPCIKLDNGKYVWGFQCRWGDSEKFQQKYGELIKETELIEIEDDIQPKLGYWWDTSDFEDED